MKNKKLFGSFIIVSSVLAAVGIVYAQARPNASITLQRQSPGLFELTIRDPDGIQTFSLQPAGKSSYGGEVKCPPTFSSKNVVFSNDDFIPPMSALVIDCAGNQVDFEIAEPDAKGLARGKVIGPAAAPAPVPAPTPAPAPVAPPPPPAKEKSLLDASYPIKELGNCANQEACLSYCDDEAHINECLAFAKKNNLLSEDEAKKADKFAELGNKGPGGCGSRKSCEAYCGNITRMDECLEWADKNGFISEKDLTEAKKIQAAVRGGAKLPGGCTSKQNCEAYCTNPSHIDECIAFAETSGLMPPEELAEAKKVVEFIKRGETPGGCKSKNQCESYCADEGHLDECISFAEKAGLVSPEELELFKKTGGKGPGGCKGRVQCEAFCNSSEHQEECFTWAQEHGVMKEEDLARMREGMDRFKEEFNKMPPEVAECLKATVGEDVLNKMLAGEPVFAKDLGEKMQACFAEAFKDFGGEFGGPGGESGGGPGGPGGEHGGFPGSFSGPGGCSNPEECFKFCTEHQEDCKGFGPPGVGEDDREGFPGGASGTRPPSSKGFRPPEGFGPPAGVHTEARQGPIIRCEKPQPGFEQYISSFDPESCLTSYPGEPPADARCDPTHEIARDNANGWYCALRQCTPPTVFATDKFGRRYCVQPQDFSPSGSAPAQDQFQKQFEQQYKEQFEQQYQQQYPKPEDQFRTGTSPIPVTGTSKICPQLPTVDSCSSGQKKEIVYTSPDCGTYYACVPALTSETLPTQPSSDITADPAVACAQKGDTWIDDKVLGSYCYHPTTEDLMKICTQNHGTWDGKTCTYPTSPSGFNVQNNSASSLRALFGIFGF